MPNTISSPFFEIVLVLVRLDYVARRGVDANHCIVRATVELSVANRIVDRVRLAIPQATEWKGIGN